MGMIITHLKRLPENKDRSEWLKNLHNNAQRYVDDEGGDGFQINPLTEEKFEEVWAEQENISRSDQLKQRYLEETRKGNVVVIELDL